MKSTTVVLLKSLSCADSLVLSIGIFLLKYSQKSNARRAGDSDPSKSIIIAHSWKKLANSAYGSLLMNKETQTDVVFVEEQVNARRKVNDTCLEKHSHLCINDIVECEMAKRSMEMDIPRDLGFFILNYAKLHIWCSFTTSVLIITFRAHALNSGKLLDTYSLYFAISENSCYDVIIHD